MNIEVRTHLYIVAVVIGAVAVSAIAAFMWPVAANTPSLWLMPMLALVIALAGRFSILLSRQAEASLFTVPLYTAVLLMHPTEAAFVGAAGTLIFQLILNRPARAVIFNTGMAALAGGLGGIVFFALRPEGASLALTQGHMVAAGLAGLVLHLHNILPVVGMVTLRKGKRFWLFWADSYVLEAVVEGMLLSLGLVAALIAVQATWGLALLALPAIVAYQVLKRTVEYAAKKGMVAEELERRLKSEVESWQGLIAPGSHQASNTLEPASSRPRTMLRSLLR
jgi:hypothetical protein